MVNNCNISDIDRIIELGKLINSNFDKLNNIEELINKKEIIGYYDNNKLVGFIIYKKLYEVIDLLYIVTDTLYRKHGIATTLMNELIKIDFERIMLEVRCDNSNAIKLYKKFNFKIINIREKYYDNIDAYVMELIK